MINILQMINMKIIIIRESKIHKQINVKETRIILLKMIKIII